MNLVLPDSFLEAQKLASLSPPVEINSPCKGAGLEPRRPNVQQPLHAENGAENQPIGAENQPQEVAIDAPQVGEQVDGHRQPVVVMQPAEQPAVFDDLQSCIKVALDFVAPENVQQCVDLAGEYRLLPKDHRAKEDKLEVKKMAIFAAASAIKQLNSLLTSRQKEVDDPRELQP
ncbi:hypothetical protein L7F22_027405 [Adiantum nelumboides]|nr:hypothetical protein [Adiantum nelumboides]